MKSIAEQVYRTLFDSLGPQDWWPGDSPLEIMIGAVLVQNTAWKNVERAIENLKDAQLLDPHRLLALPVEELEQLIRPAGYFRLKTKRLTSLLKFFVERYDGSIAAMQQTPVDRLREELLGIHGIGPETADSILLYALGLPALVVDTYTHRVFARHGWIDFQSDYHRLQEFLSEQLPEDVPTYNELHALLVNVGRHYCRRTNPRCETCPLREMLPAGGIVLEG
jgi:endonuclease-3 related protein